MAKAKVDNNAGASTSTPVSTEGEPAAKTNVVASTPPATATTMNIKAKIEERLQRAVDEAAPTKNRSPELIPLTAEYEKMRKSLRTLVTMVTNYADTTGHMNTAREDLVKHLAMMSRNGPLEQELSGLDDASTAALAQIKESAEPENVDAALKAMRKAQTEAESGSSLMAVQKFVSVQSLANGREYEKHVVTWAIEWELAVTERIDRDLAIVRKLQGDRDHYEGKVAGLRRKSNELEAKGKTSPRNQVAKLERNEEKLKDAFVRHESEAGRLCALIESVVHDGWIELYQLCRNYMKWESNRVGRESDIYHELAGVLDSMKATYKQNAPKPASTTAAAAAAPTNGKLKKAASEKPATK